MTKGNKGSYVVMLEQAKQPPKLITKVKPLGGKKYSLELIHPNTRQIIIQREEECESIDEAFKKANALRDLPEVKDVKTWYEETLFIPQPKRGKMKLKTKQSVEEEMNLELEAMENEEGFESDDFEEKKDVKAKKTAKVKKINKVKKVEKKPKKAKPVKVKKDKKSTKNKKNGKKKK